MAGPTSPDMQNLDMHKMVLDVLADNSMQSRERQPGPPQRVEGMTLGIVDMPVSTPENAFHNGEMHPDGDEFLYLISGRLRVEFDDLDDIELSPGEGCIVPQGAWHKVQALTDVQLMHITPGPRGEHRPL